MVSIIGHRIKYNGVGPLRGQWHIPSKNLAKYLPPGVLIVWMLNTRKNVLLLQYTLTSDKRP